MLPSQLLAKERRTISTLIDKLKKRTKVNPTTGCWEWQGSRTWNGYGETYWAGRLWRVHRLSAYISLGLDLDNKNQYALHKCDNPACWRWSHLYIGRQRDNLIDMSKKGRSNLGKHWRQLCSRQR